MKHLKALIPASLLLTAIACGDDEEVEEAGEEVITTLTLTFTPVDGGAPVVATFRDPPRSSMTSFWSVERPTGWSS